MSIQWWTDRFQRCTLTSSPSENKLEGTFIQNIPSIYLENISVDFWVFFVFFCPSVSSVLSVSRPCGKSEVRHRGGDSGTQETLKEEQQQTVDRESNSGHAVKTRSAPVSTSLIRKDRRNHSSYSCRSRSKSQAAKRLCGQNSWTCGPQTRDHTQMSLDRRETVSPEGEGHVTASCSAAQVDTVDQISQNSSSSLPQDATTRSDSLRKLNVTKPPEETETHEGLLQFESVQDGAADDRTENTHVPAHGFSAVRKIQRRVRIYKRKRRKIETCVLGGQSNGSHNSLLRLWELFQSSDDMDVEFHGFEF